MLIQEEKYSSCGECGRRKATIQEQTYGCDNCRKEIQHELEAGKRQHLQMTVFRHESDTSAENLEFCSWKCVLAYLPKIKSDYFINLPYLHFDSGYPKEMTGQELIRLLAKTAKARKLRSRK